MIPKVLSEDLVPDCCLDLWCSYHVLTTDFRVAKCVLFLLFKEMSEKCFIKSQLEQASTCDKKRNHSLKDFTLFWLESINYAPKCLGPWK